MNTTCQKRLREIISAGEIWIAESPERSPPPTSNFSTHSPLRHQLFDACADQHRLTEEQTAIPLGVQEIDDALPHHGLLTGNIHEWCAIDRADTSYPPLSLFTFLLGNGCRTSLSKGKYVLWLGERVWPTPYLLSQCGGDLLLERSRFVSLGKKEEITWALTRALSSQAVFAVVASLDTDLPLSFLKKLSSAAAHGETLGLLVRSPSCIRAPSSAHTRWRLEWNSPQEGEEVSCGILTLLHHKGGTPLHNQWTITISHGTPYETLSLTLPSDMVNGYRRAAS